MNCHIIYWNDVYIIFDTFNFGLGGVDQLGGRAIDWNLQLQICNLAIKRRSVQF